MKEFTYNDFKDDYIADEDYMECEGEDSFLYSLAFAFQGNIENMRVMGEAYSGNGYGVIPDGEKAVYWYGKAAKAGDRISLRQLGLLYYNYYDGDLVPQDSETAFKYFSQAEKAGDVFAAYCAGLCRYYGQGAQISDHIAYQLFEKAAAGGIQEAKDALKTLKFEEHDLIVRAENGDEEACILLAKMYEKTNYFVDVSMDAYVRAEKWWQLAAENGSVRALLELGFLYGVGYGVEKDEKRGKYYEARAFEWAMKHARENGNDPAAKYWLGKCYVGGYGVETDKAKGYALAIAAAKGGYTEAQIALAGSYDDGDGDDLPKDSKRSAQILEYLGETGDGEIKRKVANFYAVSESNRNDDRSDYWYERAAEAGEAYSQYRTAETYFNSARKCADRAEEGEYTEKNNAAKEGYKKAVYWYGEAVKSGFMEARLMLGHCYAEGLGVEKNYEEAVKILKPLARCTHGKRCYSDERTAAACLIGDIYAEGGYGVDRDEKRAFNWHYSAAIRDDKRACRLVGDAYFNGVGTGRDYSAAADWYESAIFDYDDQMYYGCEDGYDYLANVGLGDCYRLGLGVKKDEDEAFHLYDDVSKYTSDCPPADERVARCYYFGIGVEKDEEKAKDFWELAAGNGDEDAKAALKEYFGEEK